MRRLSLSSLAVLTLLSLSTHALAEPPSDTTGAGSVTAHLVAQAQEATSTVALPEAPSQDPSIPSEVQLGEVVKLFAQAVSSKNWGLLACTLVLGAVYVVRRFGASRVPWLRSDVAGISLAVVAAAALQLSAALAAGKPVTLSLVLGILATAAGASGLFSWGTKLNAASSAAKPATR